MFRNKNESHFIPLTRFTARCCVAEQSRTPSQWKFRKCLGLLAMMEPTGATARILGGTVPTDPDPKDGLLGSDDNCSEYDYADEYQNLAFGQVVGENSCSGEKIPWLDPGDIAEILKAPGTGQIDLKNGLLGDDANRSDYGIDANRKSTNKATTPWKNKNIEVAGNEKEKRVKNIEKILNWLKRFLCQQWDVFERFCQLMAPWIEEDLHNREKIVESSTPELFPVEGFEGKFPKEQEVFNVKILIMCRLVGIFGEAIFGVDVNETVGPEESAIATTSSASSDGTTSRHAERVTKATELPSWGSPEWRQAMIGADFTFPIGLRDESETKALDSRTWHKDLTGLREAIRDGSAALLREALAPFGREKNYLRFRGFFASYLAAKLASKLTSTLELEQDDLELMSTYITTCRTVELRIGPLTRQQFEQFVSNNNNKANPHFAAIKSLWDAIWEKLGKVRTMTQAARRKKDGENEEKNKGKKRSTSCKSSTVIPKKSKP